MIRKLHRNEKGGVALLLIVALMVLALPMAAGAMGQASTLSVDSGVKTRILKSQYATMGGAHHAINRLLYESGYVQSIGLNKTDTYPLPMDGRDVTVSITRTGTPHKRPPKAKDPLRTPKKAKRLYITKTVFPDTSSPNVPMLYTYTISIVNSTTYSLKIDKVHDDMPGAPGALQDFTYVPGSTSAVGFSVGEPRVEDNGVLTWDPPDLKLKPDQGVTLTFRALAAVPEGAYCNEAWVDPGGRSKGTRKTAKIVVGNPGTNRCTGAVVELTKDVDPESVPADSTGADVVTYTITIENVGTKTLHLTKVEDWLPYPFSYVDHSFSGVAVKDPKRTHDKTTGRWKLVWEDSALENDGNVTVLPGDAAAVIFQANTTTILGDYYNEFWLTFKEFSGTLYSFPAAPVSVMSVFEIVATDGNETSTAELWIGTDSHYITEWGVGP